MITQVDPRRGFRVELHEPSGRHWLYVDVGYFPDGSTRMMARPATPMEVELWDEGSFGLLADCLRLKGIKIARPLTWWQRLKRKVFGSP